MWIPKYILDILTLDSNFHWFYNSASLFLFYLMDPQKLFRLFLHLSIQHLFPFLASVSSLLANLIGFCLFVVYMLVLKFCCLLLCLLAWASFWFMWPAQTSDFLPSFLPKDLLVVSATGIHTTTHSKHRQLELASSCFCFCFLSFGFSFSP